MSFDGASRDDARALVISWANAVSRSWRADTFTLTYRLWPIAFHAAAWRHASSSTHRPIWLMRTLSSAIGTNSDGGSVPSFGCSQRTSASTPTISPLSSEMIGW